MLGNILRDDPAGVLMIAKPEYERIEPRMLARFACTIPDVVDRVRFVPRMVPNVREPSCEQLAPQA